MERLVTVEFGPSRSKRFGKALAEAQSGAGECSDVEPGRYRASFVLGDDAAAYTGLARLLEWVRHWRATEVHEEDEQVSAFHAKEMAWCASFQLNYFGECRERFQWGVMPRCALCPLFDSERAIRAGMRKERVPGERSQPAFGLHDAALIVGSDFAMIINLDFLFESDVMALLEGEIPEWIDLSAFVPDAPPEEWPDTTPAADTSDDV